MSRKNRKIGTNRICKLNLFGTFFILIFILISPLYADIYYFVDKNGIWHFTNIKNDTHYRLYMKSSNKNAELYIKDYEYIIINAANRFGIDPSLIKAVIKAESDFDHKAISIAGAKGLMQLMPQTALEMNVSDPMNPEENIFGGARYLSILIKKFHDISLAVAAYNAGPKNVEYFKGIPPFPETKAFVKKVMKYYRLYKKHAKY